MTQGAFVSFSLRPTTGPAPHTTMDRGAAPSFGARRLDRFGQARVVVGREMDDRPERRALFRRQGEAHIGAARVADENRIGKSDRIHAPP